jgi:hypothetical protein
MTTILRNRFIFFAYERVTCGYKAYIYVSGENNSEISRQKLIVFGYRQIRSVQLFESFCISPK